MERSGEGWDVGSGVGVALEWSGLGVGEYGSSESGREWRCGLEW